MIMETLLQFLFNPTFGSLADYAIQEQPILAVFLVLLKMAIMFLSPIILTGFLVAAGWIFYQKIVKSLINH